MSSSATCTAFNATACVVSEVNASDGCYSGLDYEYEYEGSSATGLFSNFVSSSSPDDTSPLLLPFQDATTSTSLTALCALMVLIRYSRSRLIQPAMAILGRRLGERTHGPDWVKEHQEQMENFTNFSFRLLYRCIVCGLGLYEFYRNPGYWYDTRQLWDGHKYHVANNVTQILYLLQLAYHVEDLGSVLFEGNARKRSDFGAMIVHHLATAVLLFGSSMTGLQRIGVVVSTLHAITDVPKDFAQVCKQLDWKWCKHAGFVVLLITWVVARVILYPFKYVRSVAFEAREYVVYKDGILSDTQLDLFIALLSVLVILNGMWCHMLIKLVIRVLTVGDKAADPMLKKDASIAGEPDKEARMVDNQDKASRTAKNFQDHVTDHKCCDDLEDDDIVGTGSDTESDTSLETCSGSSLDSGSDHELQS